MGSSSSCSRQCLLENRLSFPVCGAPASLQVVRSCWIWFSGVFSCATEKLGVDWTQRVLFFFESGGLLVWMWWGATNHDSHALWATERVWLLFLLCWVGAGRKRRRLKLGARMGRCPNHKNSHGKHYSHKTARRAKFLVKDILATSPCFFFFLFLFPCVFLRYRLFLFYVVKFYSHKCSTSLLYCSEFLMAWSSYPFQAFLG